MSLTVSRQTAYLLSTVRKNFFIVNRQKSRLRLTIKKFGGISNLTISEDFHGILAHEKSVN